MLVHYVASRESETTVEWPKLQSVTSRAYKRDYYYILTKISNLWAIFPIPKIDIFFKYDILVVIHVLNISNQILLA